MLTARHPGTLALGHDAFRVASLWFLAFAILFVAVRLLLPGVGHWLARSPHIDWVDAIVVLGGEQQRSLHGIALYKQGLAPELWLTGDKMLPGETISSAQVDAQLAIKQGVPAEVIHLLPTANTWEDGRAISAFATQRHVGSILVVTSWSHSRRALCVIQWQIASSRVRVYYDPSPASGYGPDDWWQRGDSRTEVFEELVKMGFYWWHYGLPPWSC